MEPLSYIAINLLIIRLAPHARDQSIRRVPRLPEAPAIMPPPVQRDEVATIRLRTTRRTRPPPVMSFQYTTTTVQSRRSADGSTIPCDVLPSPRRIPV